MDCSSCGTEIPPGAPRCPSCGASLEDPGELVPVLRTSDSNLLPVVKSLLAAAGIDHVVQGDQALGLFPLGAFGGGVVRRVLGATVLVRRDQAGEARELLAEFEADGEVISDDPGAER